MPSIVCWVLASMGQRTKVGQVERTSKTTFQGTLADANAQPQHVHDL